MGDRFNIDNTCHLNLLVEGRITVDDARRQTRTAAEIIKRFTRQPGLILADEVGMGKTFVALAVAAAAHFSDPDNNPVVVMVPPALARKWPIDAGVFRKKCLKGEWQERFEFNEQPISNGIEFLKTLDDDPSKRKAVVFITHGALYRSLTDNWVRLAVLRQALHGRHNVDNIRKALSRFAGDLLRMKKHVPDAAWEGLLARNPGEWLGYLKRNFKEAVPEDDDDPVPEHLWKALQDPINKQALNEIHDLLEKIPRNKTDNLRSRMKEFRSDPGNLFDKIDGLWMRAKGHLGFRLPLLIFDEAHHLKNKETRLVRSLFRSGTEDGDSVKGAFHGVFSKMLFLTATPFQLGHYELLNVLHHFETVAWDNQAEGAMNLERYSKALSNLQTALDMAQEQALRLDQAWGQLTKTDIEQGNDKVERWEEWGKKANATPDQLSDKCTIAFRQVVETEKAMREAEYLLRPWIIRHLKAREMSFNGEKIQRRESYPGKSIIEAAQIDSGLEIDRDSILPFLLAARTVAIKPTGRAVYAEGLASSYEAFLNTHKNRTEGQDDDSDDQQEEDDPRVMRYADAIKKSLISDEGGMLAGHPKIEATVRKVLALWEAGEKVVVFCHYIETGKALQLAISRAIRKRIIKLSADKMPGATIDDVEERLERYGIRFFDSDGSIRQHFDEIAGFIVDQYPSLIEDKDKLVDILRRFVRTPAYLARYFRLNQNPDDGEIDEAFDTRDSSELSLRDVFKRFLEFLGVRCDGPEREEYLKAVDEVQTGTHRVTAKSYFQGEETQAEGILPNVRLVNGKTKAESRRKLMLAFNTPFYPEILIASAVLAEGVDLHLNCRYIIHHDLCWNPSTLEQRTGRVDRIGAKAEKCCKSIEIYLPYIGGTQDQRMFQVVMDRERWFKVVMGEEMKTDSATVERLADRVPLPTSLAERLAFRLEVLVDEG